MFYTYPRKSLIYHRFLTHEMKEAYNTYCVVHESVRRFADIGDYLKEKYDKSAVKVSGVEGKKSSERFRRGVEDSPVELPVSKR